MGTYTPDAWASQVKDPKNRIEIVSPEFEKLGGSIEAAYMAFGENDLIIIANFPDNISAAALAIGVAAGGAMSNLKTIPLLDIEEGLEALKKAATIAYNPPGK